MTTTTRAMMTMAAALRLTKGLLRNHLTSVSQCKAVEESEVARKYCEMACHKECADHNQQHSAGHFYCVQMPPESSVKREEAIDSQGGQQKRHSQPKRVDGQQHNAFRHCLLGCCDGEDGGQNRTNARSPTKGKCEADDERSPRSLAGACRVHPLIRIERTDL